MQGRRLLNSLHYRGLPRVSPGCSSSLTTFMESLAGSPCVVTASRCRSSSSCGESGSGAAVPGRNPGQAAEASWGPTMIGEERERPCAASWVPWRLRWNGSQGHVGFAGSRHSPLAQPAVEQSVRDAEEAATSARFAALPTTTNEPVQSGVVEGVVREGYKARESAGSRSSSSTPSALAQLGLAVAAGAMASGRGRYALEAAGEASTWDPEQAVEVATLERALEVRQHFGLADDSDLAFAFENYQDAMSAGGHALAAQWASARAQADEGLLAAGAKVVEDSGAGSARDRVPKPSVKPMIQRRQGVTLSSNRYGPDAVVQRVESLAQCFEEMSVQRPTHRVTDTRLDEWKKQLRRLSQQKVTQADSQTIINAIRTWRELAHFQEDRGLEVVEDLDLASFIQEGTDGPARALASLKWLNKAGTMGWNLTNIQVPAAPNVRTRKRQQAVVAEPGMLPFLEAGIITAAEHNNPEWMALLANWLCAVGCLRHRHITRSSPQRLSASTIHAWCTQGKQAHSRNGFTWSAPAEFSNGFPWAQRVIDAIQELPDEKQLTCGMAFDGDGIPYPISEVQKKAQLLFENHVDDARNITTYTWRRLAPTVGLLSQFTDLELNALGDWTDEVKSSAKMPAHYAGSKEAMSTRMKHMAYAIMANLTQFESWEVIPIDDLHAAVVKAEELVAKRINQDVVTKWQAKASPTSVKRSFNFVQQAQEQRDKAKEEAAKAGRPAMPPSIGGKLLTKFLRNGTPLCALFQSGQCDEEPCPEAHVCAVVSRTGRACGGKHGAHVCWMKKAKLAEGTVTAPVLPHPSNKEEATAEAVPGFTSSSSSDSIVPLAKRARKGKEAPVTPPKAGAPVTPPKAPPKAPAAATAAAPVITPARVKAAPKLQPQPKAKKAAGASEASTPKQPPVAKSSSSRPAHEVHESGIIVERPGHIPADEDFALPPMPATLNPPKEEVIWDRLATIKGKYAQAPTKILEMSSGGQLWLAGLPTAANRHRFPPATLQVACFTERPEERNGVVLPNALLRRFPVAVAAERGEAWKDLWPLILQSLYCGEVIVIHCIAGRHRAGGASALVRAVMTGETFEEASDWIAQRRDTDVPGFCRDKEAARWLQEAARNTKRRDRWPRPSGYLATPRSALHLQGFKQVPLCMHHQKSEKAQRLTDPMFTEDGDEAVAWDRPWCRACLARAPASWIPRDAGSE